MPTNAVPAPHRVLVVDDEPSISDLVATALRFEGFDVSTASTGNGALEAVELVAARPRRSRRHAARLRRLRSGPPAGREGQERAGAVPDRTRRDRRQGARPERRRRRLRDQAVLARRARGPRACGVAPQSRQRSRHPHLVQRSGDGRRHPRGVSRRPVDRTHCHRIPTAALLAGERAQGVEPRAVARPCMGLRLRRRLGCSRDVHQLLA